MKDDLYLEYTKLRKREKEILDEHEQLRKEYGENEHFIEEEKILKNARRKLDEIKQVL